MAKSKLEYIWLDGYTPTQSLRGKTQVRSDFGGTLEECPMWSFDGSSTEQADGSDSDCLLKPVAIYPDPCRKNAYLVMTEVLNADGTPHPSNGRATIKDDDDDFWFGFEQEYFLWDTQSDRPPGFPVNGYPGPQGPYYCSVGASNAYGRQVVEEHLDACLEAGINVEGINGEVAAGWLATSWNAAAKNTDWPSTGTRSRSAIPTGMVRACTPTSQTVQCETAAKKPSSTRFAKASAARFLVTSASTVLTMTSV